MISVSRQQGLSLLELLLAMALGLVLVGSALQIFLSQRHTFSVNEGLMRVQENGRFTHYWLTHTLSMAGFMGCGAANSDFSLSVIAADAEVEAMFKNREFIKGYHAVGQGWQPALPDALQGKVRAGNDVVTVYYVTPVGASVQEGMQHPTDDITVSRLITFEAGEVAVISNCYQGDVFVVTAVSAGDETAYLKHEIPQNKQAALSHAYEALSEVGALYSRTYYIGDTGRTNIEGLPIIALYQQDSRGANEELVEGVEKLRIQYGVDTREDGNVDSVLPANEILVWSQVKSMEMALLLNSVDGVFSQPEPYEFRGERFLPEDHLLRRQWDIYTTAHNMT